MSFFSDVGRGALGFGTGGFSEVFRALNDGGRGSSAPYQMKPLADPNLIKTDPSLMTTLGAVAEKPQNDINSLYGRIRGNFNADARGRGVRPGSYASNRLAVSQDIAGQNVKNALAKVLGDTAYKDFQGERGYTQQEGLAREVAALNKPTTLEEILGGLSSAASVGGGLYGALGGRSPRPGSTGPVNSPSLSLYDPYSSGYSRYM